MTVFLFLTQWSFGVVLLELFTRGCPSVIMTVFLFISQWSFGVVMWELLTRGCPPYPDVDVLDVKSYLISGQRMDRPDYAPDEMLVKCIHLNKKIINSLGNN